jgi:hypothetical protein
MMRVDPTTKRGRTVLFGGLGAAMYAVYRVAEYVYGVSDSSIIDLTMAFGGLVSGLLLMIVLPLICLAAIELVFEIDVVDWDL